MRYLDGRRSPTLEERAHAALAMLKTGLSRARALDRNDLADAIRDIDWRTLRDDELHAVKQGLSRALRDADPSAVRSSIVEGIVHARRERESARRRDSILTAAGAAAVGAVVMHFCDPERGEFRRAAARERLRSWYRGGRGQLDEAWRRFQGEIPGFGATGADASDRSGGPQL